NFLMIGTNSAAATGSGQVRAGAGVAQQIMWNLHLSIRYASNDGGIYTAGSGLRSDHVYGVKGDRITVYLEDSYPTRSLINFFLNGRLVFRQWVGTNGSQLYPAVGCSQGPATFKVTWPRSNAVPAFNMLNFTASLLNWLGYRNIDRDDVNNTLTMLAHDDKPRAGYSVQAPRPLDKDHTYFEVELLTTMDANIGPSIGLTPGFTSRYQYPGWKFNTIGYHSDDGRFYNDCGDMYMTGERLDTSVKVGSRMGCGIVFEPDSRRTHRESQLVLVYFTRDDEIVYKKVRLLPEGGFYPTVGLYGKGDTVKVVNSTSPPFISPNFRDIFEAWRPVYCDFRFSEGLRYSDLLVQDHGNTEESCSILGYCTLTVNSVQTHSIQCHRKYEDECFFKVRIDKLSDEGEIQIGAAQKTFAVHGALLRQRKQTAMYFSKNKGNTFPISKGDCIHVLIKKEDPGTSKIHFLINNHIGHRLVVKHNFSEPFYPTICFTGGAATISVAWQPPDGIPFAPGVFTEEEMQQTVNGGTIQFVESMMKPEGTETKPTNDKLPVIKNTRADEAPVFSPANEECNETDQIPGPAVYNDKQAVLGKNKRGKNNKTSKSGACAMM
ncbi:hypothetical protein DPMN_086619, partial [Dreissena polymorpha]